MLNFMGRHKEALNNLKKQYKIFAKKFGQNSFETADILLEIGRSYLDMGHPEKALPILLHAEKILQDLENNNKIIFYSFHKNITIAFVNFIVAETYMDLNQPEKAIPLYKKSLSSYMLLFNDNLKGQTINIASRLCKAYIENGQYEKGYALCMRVLRQAKKHYYYEADTLNNIGLYYLKTNDLAEAEKYFKKAYDDISDSEYSFHLKAEIGRNLGLVHIKTRNPSQARYYLEYSLKHYQKIYDEKHHRIQGIKEALSKMNSKTAFLKANNHF